jgi:hypothetical protein
MTGRSLLPSAHDVEERERNAAVEPFAASHE